MLDDSENKEAYIMNKIKVFISTLLIATLVVGSTAFAAVKSPEKKPINPDNTTVNVVTEYTYTGSDISPEATVVYEGKTLIMGTDYLLVAPKIKNVGTYIWEIEIIGIGHFQGSFTIKVTVTVKESETTRQTPTTEKPTSNNPTTAKNKVLLPSKVKVKKAYKKKSAKKLTVKIKKKRGVKGYQIFVYKTKKNAKKKKKVLFKKFISKNKAKLIIKSKKFKNKKKLYVRVRAFKLDGNKKIYGPLSKVKKVKIKR